MRFLHAADIHLDSPLRGLERYPGAPVAAIRGATRRAFENLTALAIEEAVDFVLLVGDLYDGNWRDYNTGLFFTNRMGRLHDAGIPVFLVAGNHDAASQITRALRPPPNLTVFSTRAPETRVIEHLGVAIHGQGFPTRAVTEDLSRAYPTGDPALFNIGLLHTSLDGRPGHEPYAPCTLDGLRSKGYQYWALGHVHRRELIARDPYVVFPGNTQGRHVRESGPKGCTLVEVEADRVVAIEHRPLDSVRWTLCDVDVTAARDLDQVLAEVRQSLLTASEQADGRLLAVRCRLIGECPMQGRFHAERDQLTNECRAIAGTIGDAELWLERLTLEAAPNIRGAALAREDAFGGLLQSIAALELDEARRLALSAELEALAVKLPPALRSGEGGFDPRRPEQIQASLEDIKALLVEELLGGGPEDGS